jgi:hypothetical protein
MFTFWLLFLQTVDEFRWLFVHVTSMSAREMQCYGDHYPKLKCKLRSPVIIKKHFRLLYRTCRNLRQQNYNRYEQNGRTSAVFALCRSGKRSPSLTWRSVQWRMLVFPFIIDHVRRLVVLCSAQSGIGGRKSASPTVHELRARRVTS